MLRARSTRFVPPTVLFGLLILAALITTPLVFYMRYGRWTSFAVAVTWLLMALVTLLGAGACADLLVPLVPFRHIALLHCCSCVCVACGGSGCGRGRGRLSAEACISSARPQERGAGG